LRLTRETMLKCIGMLLTLAGLSLIGKALAL
jgi:hypothetical protein